MLLSLARSVELTAVTLDDLSAVQSMGIGAFLQVVSDVHRRLSDFIHAVVVHRRDEAVRRWPDWIREDAMVHPYRWLRSDLVPPAPSLQCQLHLTPGGSGVLADPARIDDEFRKAWLPYFCRSGQRDTSLERKGASAGSLDGWGWRELKVLPDSWFDELARILFKVEDVGVWPDGLLDACIAMDPKTDGHATLFGQRPLSVLPIVYRIWASARMGFGLGYLTLSSVLGVVVGRWRHGKLLLILILRKFLLGLLILMFVSSSQM